MKKIILILTVVLMAAVVFNSCKKEKTVQPQKQEVSAKDKAITQKILNFKQKLFAYKEMPNAKDGLVMPVDSAVWYSEALLNYTYDEGKSLNNYTTATGQVEVPSSNGQILMTDLYAAYNELETLLAAQQQQNPDAELVLADISIKEENGNTSFVLTSGFGDDDGGGDPPTNIWYQDAAIIIKNTVNINTPYPVNGYYINITSVNVDYSGYWVDGYYYAHNFRTPGDPPTLDNWYDYITFHNTSMWPVQNYHMYLIPAEMSFYTNYAFTICNTTMFNLVPVIAGKNFIGMNAVGLLGPYPYHTVILHKYYLSYGTVVYNGGGN